MPRGINNDRVALYPKARKLREEGLSYREIGEKLGMGKQTVSDLLRWGAPEQPRTAPKVPEPPPPPRYCRCGIRLNRYNTGDECGACEWEAGRKARERVVIEGTYREKVLAALADGPPLGAAEVSRLLGCALPKASNLLSEMVSDGLLAAGRTSGRDLRRRVYLLAEKEAA